MLHMERDPARAQAPHPGAQQWRRLQVTRKDAAGATDKRFDAQCVRPVANRGGIELGKPARDFAATRAVASGKCVDTFTVREIEAAFSRDQELASDRTEALIDMHIGSACTRGLGCHQAGWATADDGDACRPAGFGAGPVIYRCRSRLHAVRTSRRLNMRAGASI
jgi:hypothetical protein